MADKTAQEKTEQPTPERLRKSREEGRVPVSKELPSAMILTAMLIALAMGATSMCDFFIAETRQGLSLAADSAASATGYASLLRGKTSQAMMIVMPFLLVGGVASILSSVAVSGWTFAPKAAGLKFDRVNPISGLKNLFSLKSLVNLLVTIAKMTILLVIVWDYLSDKLSTCLLLRWETAEGTLIGVGRLLFGLVVRTAVGIAAIAAVDWLYQIWNHRRQLRMSKQEVKEEMKERELSQEVKGRIRGIQIEMTRKRMLQEVPNADVVIVNPTHLAVALKYETGQMEAPVVVAKGPDLLCEKIKEIATANNVPIVHRPELARAIYSATEVGEAIPEVLFVAVAEVLAMIYRTRKNRAQTAWSNAK